MILLVGKLCKLIREETAASLPEYALLLALITIACLAAISAIGNQISSFLTGLASTL